MKYRISVTRNQKSQYNESIVSSPLTDQILVPNCLKAQDQQNLHYWCIQHCEESVDLSYSSLQES